jgi:hypothetical protein
MARGRLGFVITTLFVSNSFAMRDLHLLWIDGGHWLIVLVLMGRSLMGAIIGFMGFKTGFRDDRTCETTERMLSVRSY